MTYDDDTVGYKRPPKGCRFKSGKSGNPRGRPKGSHSFKSDLAAEMRERITLRDKDGRPRRISKQKALIKLIFASALQNEKSAITALLACMKFFGTDQDEQSVTEVVDLEDLDMIKAYVARTEARLKQQNESGPNKVKTKKSREASND